MPVLSPLVWNGSTLAIPRASSTKDGYLSKNDFILFSGGTVVPVTSFNTRTGEVILLEDDVLAALGYAPINKAGDIMMGPLTLAGPPSSALQAATKGYVDSLGPGGGGIVMPGTLVLTDFGASGSAQTFIGAISAGSSTLTLTTSTHDFQVGQGITIVGAGNIATIDPGLGVLVSRITAIAGAVITIASPAIRVVSGVTVRHDESVAVQAAINAVFAAGGGTIVTYPGEYWLDGPFTDINSIIKIPKRTNYPPDVSEPVIAIAFVGPPQPFVGFASAPAISAIFRTHRIGVNSDSSMIAAALWDGGTNVPNTSNVTIHMRDVTWRTYPNPQISAVDMGMAGNALFNNVNIDAELSLMLYDDNANEPTHSTFGLRTPRVNASGCTAVEFNQTFVTGYGTGIWFAEQFRSTWFAIFACKIGMQCNLSFHPCQGIGLIWHCPTWIKFNGHQAVDFSLDIESGQPGHWYSPIPGSDIVETSPGAAQGFIKYSKVQTDTGDAQLADVVGCDKLTLVSTNGIGNRFGGDTSFGNVSAINVDATNLDVTEVMSITEQPVSFGIDDSASPGHRSVQVPNVVAVSLLANLVSYWKLDESSPTATRADSHGSAPFLPVTSVATAAGRYGTLGASFDATNHLEATDASLQTGNNSFAVACWVKLDDKTHNQEFLMKGTGSTQNEYFVGYDKDADRFRFGMVTAGGAFTVRLASSAGPISTGTWYLVMAWFDYPNDQMFIQVNNLPVDTTVPALPQSAGTAPLNCGAYGTGLTNGAFATVEEIAFWKPRVLDAATRAALWNSGSGVPFGSWT